MRPGDVCAQPGRRCRSPGSTSGLLFYFAISSLAVYGATLAGWASHNKWALLGGLRASSQMMSYEVTMGMAVLGVVPGLRHAGARRDGRAADVVLRPVGPGAQLGHLPQPLGFVLFFTAAIAETKRTPFDIPEGEPEIIGYFVEYSGLRFGMFFLGEFIEIVFSSAIMVTVFFGGWHLPVPFGVQHLAAGDACRTSLFVLVSAGGLDGARCSLFCSFQLLIRWSLPRFRPDQLMQLGWQRLLPLSLANVVVDRAGHPVLPSQRSEKHPMAVGVKVVSRPGQPGAADVPAGDRRGAGRHLPALREELLRQRHRSAAHKTDIVDDRVPGGEEDVPASATAACTA